MGIIKEPHFRVGIDTSPRRYGNHMEGRMIEDSCEPRSPDVLMSYHGDTVSQNCQLKIFRGIAGSINPF